MLDFGKTLIYFGESHACILIMVLEFIFLLV
jgi:hypothetical protein